MVDPISNDERSRTLRWVKIGTVLLVGLSAGLIAVQSGGSTEAIAGATVGGIVVGAALVWYLFPDIDALAPASSKRYRR